MRAFAKAALIACAFVAMAAPATAQEAIRWIGNAAPLLRPRANIAVPAYHVTFITQQQGTSAASIEARVRLNTVLANVDDATMQRLADEAHADFIAQAQAAGLTVLPNDAARALAAGLEAVPGNRDVKGVGAGITIGRSIRRGYTALGATEAPLLDAYHSPPGAIAGGVGLGQVGASGRLGRAAKEADAVAVIPALTFDYVNMDVSTGRSILGRATASADATAVFSLRASKATFVSAGNAGPGYMLGLSMREDWTVPTEFATVIQGGAEVREGTMVPVPDGNYIERERARGDAVVVDLPVWEGLVRDGFRAFNAAVVAHIVDAKN